MQSVHLYSRRLAEIFKKQGLPERGVTNKVHYVCNSRDERREFDAALAALGKVAEVIGLESDGCPCLPPDDEDASDAGTARWRGSALALMDGAMERSGAR